MSEVRLIDANALQQEYINENGKRLLLIDVAPTVEVTDYDTGYQDGLEDGLNDIRPQGEWIKNETRPNECQCANCGNYDLSYFPFCHWCGAQMLGGEKNDNKV